MESNEEKSFKVQDKRRIGDTNRDIEENKKKEDVTTKNKSSKTDKKPSSQKPPLPEIDFSFFIISLSSSAAINFGDIPDPINNKKEVNLPLAKQTIDIISMLKEKTKNNLNPSESKLIDNLLYDLQMRYVKATDSFQEK